ncbi:hypothetical protein [Tepidimonas aquatica]|uniref:Uncharacterized protein n=1 Tax=Tepidimonas aquatica TaxID=247482 RepID=A0A554WHJ5_9BURK|nr:hypothetical protein [Tepidimonas aquatica]TSE23057.1 hypothetical protein Taqua_01895 [Tepidimonas aquatica]
MAEKQFNTAGPSRPDDHYMLDPLQRIDVDEVLALIEAKRYFVLHAPHEVDALVGDTLISLLRQIRAGYAQRPQAFPQTVVLCGVRDVRDYRIHSGGGDIITGGSAFNIKAESLRLGNFSREETVACSQPDLRTVDRAGAWMQRSGINANGMNACRATRTTEQVGSRTVGVWGM